MRLRRALCDAANGNECSDQRAAASAFADFHMSAGFAHPLAHAEKAEAETEIRGQANTVILDRDDKLRSVLRLVIQRQRDGCGPGAGMARNVGETFLNEPVTRQVRLLVQQ